jgi:uncharacterized membrane protein
MRRLTQIGPYTRILLTLLVTTGVYLGLSGTLDWHVRVLVAWCGGALFFLIQIGSMFARLDADGVRARCQSKVTEGHAPMLVGGVLVTVVSIAAVIYLLDDVQARAPVYRLHVAFSPLAIASSWLILQTLFAIYYARLYYQKAGSAGGSEIAGGLRFATAEPPDYWDFLYFSCTLAMCYGVSDIAVVSRFIRRVTLAQTLICFFYYTVIIGLVMNAIGTVF